MIIRMNAVDQQSREGYRGKRYVKILKYVCNDNIVCIL